MQIKRLFVTLILSIGLSLALLWLLGRGIPVANADGFTVTTANDENNGGCPGPSCSLREAIIAANSNVEADIIRLPAGTFTLTIAGTDEDASATGDLDITSSDTLSIIGAGPDLTIIDANGIDRVLHIHTGTVIISGVTIFNGSVTGHGGGIYSIYADLEFINTVICSNVASFRGGGIYVVGFSSAMFSKTQVYDNSALYGGGAFAAGVSAMLSGMQVYNNSAYYGGGVSGGGGSLTLNRMQVYSNSASYGGGVYVDGGSVTLNGIQVYRNSASAGSGVHVAGGSVMLSRSRVYDNLPSSSGGGISVRDHGSVLLSGTQVYNNLASVGGGIYVDSGSAILSGTQVYSNLASFSGGGVYVSEVSATLSMSGTQVYSNSASSYGGGIFVNFGGAMLNETQVYGNSADADGGGVCVSGSSATLSMSGGGVHSNSAFDRGGGVFVYYGSATLSGTQVYSNSASIGGGVLVYDGSAILSGTQVYSNSASSYGGGVYVRQDSAALTVSGGDIHGNSATDSGGGVHVNSGSMMLNGTQVYDNSASSDGGGIYIRFGKAVLSETQVYSNSASSDGGGIYVLFGKAVLSGTQVYSNSASSDGGGIYVWYSEAMLSTSGGRIHDNSASAGGGAYIEYGSMTLSRTQIAANTAITGSALYNSAGIVTPTTPLTVAGDIYQIGGIFEGGGHDLRIEGALGLDGGNFYAPASLQLTGPFTHTGGTYWQTQNVNGSSDVGFPKSGGAILNANGQDLGSTEVALSAGFNCAGPPADDTVAHCAVITPTASTGRDATLTLFYNDSEIPSGHSCASMEAYHWDGTWDHRLTRDTTYGSDGRMCGSDPQSIRVMNVTTFSPFVLSGPTVPEITVLPAGLDFGSQDVDEGPTMSQTIVITNDGTVNLNITSVGLVGNDADQFSIKGDTGEATLTPGSRRTVQVAFDPTTMGVKSANLSIQSDDSDEPTVDVSLSGTGTAPVLQVDKAVDTGDLSRIPLGGVVTYTIVIRSDGNGVAFNVVVTDPLPSAVTFGDWVGWDGSAVLPPPGTAGLPTVTVTWSPGDLAAGTTYTLSFTADVVTDTRFAGQMVENTAYVVADNADPDDDSASFIIESDDFPVYLPLVMRNH